MVLWACVKHLYISPSDPSQAGGITDGAGHSTAPCLISLLGLIALSFLFSGFVVVVFWLVGVFFQIKALTVKTCPLLQSTPCLFSENPIVPSLCLPSLSIAFFGVRSL